MFDLSFSSSASFGATVTTGISAGHQRERPVLELARRVGLGVDVGDLLQLERALERDRIVQAAAEEQRVLLLREALRPGDDLRLEREHGAERLGQVAQLLQVLLLLLLRASASCSFASVSASRNSAASWVVKALVEATPISTPAWVRKLQLASRASSRWSRRCRSRACASGRATCACCSAASVSAVSPDCETTTTSVVGSGTLSR